VGPSAKELTIVVGERTGAVAALLVRPPDAWLVYVLAHGAGAGMRHPFLETIAQRLAERGIATLRYQFPYMERRAPRPDPPAVAEAAVRAAVDEAARLAPGLALVAGGKSSPAPSTSIGWRSRRCFFRARGTISPTSRSCGRWSRASARGRRST
jgi:hypothetical protein